MDLDPRNSAQVNSVAALIGLTAGALGTSILVQFAPAPLLLAYLVLAMVLAFQALASCFLPETAARRPGVLASMLPRVTVPRHAWLVLMLIAPVDIAAWALGGFYF